MESSTLLRFFVPRLCAGVTGLAVCAVAACAPKGTEVPDPADAGRGSSATAAAGGAGGARRAGGAGVPDGVGGTPSARGGSVAGGAAASSSANGGASAGGAPVATGGAGTAAAGRAGGSGSAGTLGISGAGSQIGAADFAATDLDAPSLGASITMQSIGAPGWYPSRRDPAAGGCSAYQTATCCMARHELSSDQLSPWNEELVLTLRGPMRVKQLITYQPSGSDSGPWEIVSAWDERRPESARGVSVDPGGFIGVVGNECLRDIAREEVYPCGPQSSPFCPPAPADRPKHYGWQGSKLFVLLATMPHVGSTQIPSSANCQTGTSGNWFDAPWIGLSAGELVRSGKFGDCHCYAKDPARWQLADGCGQFNAFEVVNDNNEFKNLDVFSTNLFAYHGYVGDGPCGTRCNVSTLAPDVDLIDRATSGAAPRGATLTPERGPGALFRRPSAGYRYFLLLFDVGTRTIQLGVVHPRNIPASLTSVLPKFPEEIPRSVIDSVLALRLPG